jgi:hypothetical protein
MPGCSLPKTSAWHLSMHACMHACMHEMVCWVPVPEKAARESSKVDNAKGEMRESLFSFRSGVSTQEHMPLAPAAGRVACSCWCSCSNRQTQTPSNA